MSQGRRGASAGGTDGERDACSKTAPKLVHGPRRHNHRVAQQCGVADATLPMTTNAKAAVGER